MEKNAEVPLPLVPVTTEPKRVCGLKKRTCVILSILITLLLVGGGVVAGLYFGGVIFKSSSSSGQTLSLGQAPSSASSKSRRDLAKRQAVSSSVIASNSAYAFAQVDGIRLNVKKVNFSPKDPTTSVASVSVPNQLELGPGTSAASLTVKVAIESGTYVKAEVQVENNYAVKAYCKTKNYSM
jgi:hypothetical protein